MPPNPSLRALKNRERIEIVQMAEDRITVSKGASGGENDDEWT
jgi:hypothetical protein